MVKEHNERPRAACLYEYFIHPCSAIYRMHVNRAWVVLLQEIYIEWDVRRVCDNIFITSQLIATDPDRRPVRKSWLTSGISCTDCNCRFEKSVEGARLDDKRKNENLNDKKKIEKWKPVSIVIIP